MRIITLNRYNSHTEPLFKNLKLLKIEGMLKLQELTFYFKYIHKHLPSYLLNWEIIPSINIHNYNTRAKENIHTLRAKYDFAMKCLRHSLPHTINETPDAIKNKIYSQLAWIYNIYKNLFANYSDICTLSNCMSTKLKKQYMLMFTSPSLHHLTLSYLKITLPYKHFS